MTMPPSPPPHAPCLRDHIAAMQTILSFLREHVSAHIDDEVSAVGHAWGASW